MKLFIIEIYAVVCYTIADMGQLGVFQPHSAGSLATRNTGSIFVGVVSRIYELIGAASDAILFS